MKHLSLETMRQLSFETMMKKLLFSLCLLCSLSGTATAQLYQYLHPSDGLGSRRVLGIEKGHKGFLWFLTHEGIDRYNGQEYAHYPLVAYGKELNAFPQLNTLQTDSAGIVWEIGKSGQLFRYNTRQDRFDLVFDLAQEIPCHSRLPLNATYLDRTAHRIWLCTDQQQYLFDMEQHTLTALDNPVKATINCLTRAHSNLYFLGTDQGIRAVRLDGQQLKDVNLPELDHLPVVTYLYYHAPSQTLVIDTLVDGLSLYHIPTRRLTDIPDGLQDINVNAIVDDPLHPQQLWIATNGDGVYQLNLTTQTLSRSLQTDLDRANQMNGNIILDLYLDDEQRLWMAVYPVGVTIYSARRPGYQWIQHAFDNPHSLVDNQVNFLLEDSEGDLWYATNNGLCFYRPSTDRWTSLLSDTPNGTKSQGAPSPAPQTHRPKSGASGAPASESRAHRTPANRIFLTLCELRPGVLLAGGYMSGLYTLDKRTLTTRYFQFPLKPQPSDSLSPSPQKPDKYVRCLYKDSQRRIWVGGYYYLKNYHPDTQETHTEPVEFPITCLAEKDSTHLWVGTLNGLFLYHQEHHTWEPIELGTCPRCINTLYPAPDGTVYVGTHGSGLWTYHPRTGQRNHFDTRHSALVSDNIYCILPAANGDLMISTEKGLSRYHRSRQTFTNWTRERGLLSTTFHPAAGITTRNGKFLFGCADGAILLADSLLTPEPFHSRMVFSNFQVLYHPIVAGEAGSPLSENIDDTRHLVLRHDQNTLSLDVSSINYDQPSHILFSWKLEGFYDEWTTPTAERRIRYTNLSPGHYRLRVRSILSDDNRVLEERSLTFTLTPPWWATGWAYLLYFGLLLILGGIVLRYLWLWRDRNQSKQKIRFFLQTAHDIRTPLTLIKAPLNELLKREPLSEESRAQVELALQNTDQLSELAGNLINFEKEELYRSEAYVTRVELQSYLRNQLEPFEDYARKLQVHLQFQTDCGTQTVWIDPNKMDSILRNLLTNALKYSRPGGIVTLQAHCDDTRWYLRITDTGIGIPSQEQPKLFHRFFRGRNVEDGTIPGSGIGMMLTYKLVERHQGTIRMQSEENRGTTFSLSFPMESPKYHYRTETIEQTQATTQATTQPDADATVMSSHEPTQTPATDEKTEAPNSTTPKKSILVVEDHAELRAFLLNTLAADYQVSGATNGREALEQVKQQQPDLVLSDVMMPVMSGDELCHRLKNNLETSHIPVILLTALSDKESILKGLQTQADKYIVKPFDLDVLKADIASVLANRERMRKRYAQFHFEASDRSDDPGLDPDQAFLLKAAEFIRTQAGRELNVESLCEAMHMSRSSLYNKIKALTQDSPSDFIRKVRLNEACQLLKSQRYTIAEVADLVGFNDPKYFTDIFKKYYGMTPSAYMKQQKEA